MDGMNAFMERHKLPEPKREQLRAHILHARALREEQSQLKLLDQLTPFLKGMVMLHCYGSHVASVPFLTLDPTRYPQHAQTDASHEARLFAQHVRRQR